ncbi:MAG TPA: type II toxin-antitoxin system VapC family toxin [Bryobacteraceae bacterium]|nr:type II toxin-antitoxin system VapC family toxin [Bryobacteraceae bacterium]
MAIILDTNALSAFADGDEGLRDAIHREKDLAMPVIVLGEYLFGIRSSRHRARYQDWLNRHSLFWLVLSIGVGTAECYAEIWGELKSKGRPVPTNDVWIAALAREHGYPIASRDSHFDLVAGVRRISWTPRL